MSKQFTRMGEPLAFLLDFCGESCYDDIGVVNLLCGRLVLLHGGVWCVSITRPVYFALPRPAWSGKMGDGMEETFAASPYIFP